MDLDALSALARGGLVTTSAAEEAGFDRRDLARAAARGHLVRVGHGHYAVDMPEDAAARHRLRAAAVLDGVTGAAACHHTGLVLRELPTFRARLSTVHVARRVLPRTASPGVKTWLRTDLRIEHLSVGAHLVPALPVAECIIHSGLAHPESALVSADAAMRRQLVTPEEIEEELARVRGFKGVRDLRRVLAWADPLHETPGESRMGLGMRRLGYAYTPQVWIGRDRVDALLDEAPVVLEFDGALKYDSREALVQEKRREDRIRARGYGFVRFTWPELDDLGAMDARVRRAIALTR